MKRFALFCAAAAGLFSGPAMAAPIVWELKDAFLADDVSPVALTGTFTTNEARTQLLAIDVTAGAGKFGGFNFGAVSYNDASKANWVSLPTQGFQISLPGNQLRLNMFLTATGAASLPNSYEYQSTAGSRTITGSVALYAAPSVPEPASWAMMIGGFALAGAAMRRRNAAVLRMA